MKTKLTIIGTLAVLLAGGLIAQETPAATTAASPSARAPSGGEPIISGVSRRIHSKVLGEERTILIRVPANYNRGKKRFPVLYKLDGGRTVFLQTVGTVEYLADWSLAKDCIVVGIENTDRMRDMWEGEDNFRQFIRTELIPFIDQNYRTNGFRILCGQSASSVFALKSFLKEPDLFDAYVLGSFGLYKQELADDFQKAMNGNPNLKKLGKKYLFVTNGKKDALDKDGAVAKRGAQFLETLRQVVPASVLIESRYYEDEGHVPFPFMYDGLKWLRSCEKAAAK